MANYGQDYGNQQNYWDGQGQPQNTNNQEFINFDMPDQSDL